MSQPRTAQFYHATFDPVIAVLVVMAAVGTMLVTLIALRGAGAPRTIALATAELALALTPVALLRRAQLPLAAVGLTWPRARFVVAGVLIGSALWFVNLHLAAWIDAPPNREIVALVERDTLFTSIVAIGLFPAFCEELVFRGVLARALARRLPAIAAIAIAAAMFSLYHQNLAQLAPTFTLGLALGTVAVRADSAVPAMIGHALNNTIALLVSRGPLDGVLRAFAEYPSAALAASLGVVAAGVALALPRGAS